MTKAQKFIVNNDCVNEKLDILLKQRIENLSSKIYVLKKNTAFSA